MIKRIKIFYLIALSAFLTFSTITPTYAQTVNKPAYESTVYDLINAVNALRAAYGLPAYSINSILMFTAQNQSDFMAATGDVTHSGPGGSTFTQRLLAAGYPLAGDLSLGGFRAENIASFGVSGTALDVINAWMGDAPHQNTMLSPNLTEIGAGVTMANGRVYYVIDCAMPTTGGGVVPAGTSVVAAGSSVPVADAVIYPVAINTPNANGQVIHEVQSGQALWSIAITYNVKIDEIKQLNNLAGNDIYPGEKLLIKYAPTSTPEPPTTTPTLEVTITLTSSATNTPTITPVVIEIAQTPVISSPQNNSRVTMSAIAIVVLAILGAGIFMSLGSSREPS